MVKLMGLFDQYANDPAVQEAMQVAQLPAGRVGVFSAALGGRQLGSLLGQAAGYTDPRLQKLAGLEKAKSEILGSKLKPGDKGFNDKVIGSLYKNGLIEEAMAFESQVSSDAAEAAKLASEINKNEASANESNANAIFTSGKDELERYKADQIRRAAETRSWATVEAARLRANAAGAKIPKPGVPNKNELQLRDQSANWKIKDIFPQLNSNDSIGNEIKGFETLMAQATSLAKYYQVNEPISFNDAYNKALQYLGKNISASKTIPFTGGVGQYDYEYTPVEPQEIIDAGTVTSPEPTSDYGTPDEGDIIDLTGQDIANDLSVLYGGE